MADEEGDVVGVGAPAEFGQNVVTDLFGWQDDLVEAAARRASPTSSG
jgi:hypothetical protein